jgi:hypothetical protein
MSVTLAKTKSSIVAGQIRAAVNRGVRANDLNALWVEFGYRADRASK